MIAIKAFEIANDLKTIEERVTALQDYLQIIHNTNVSIEFDVGSKPKLKLYPNEVVSKKVVNILIEEMLADYNKKIEELKKEGIKITNFFEKEKIEKEINELKKELDGLWGRGLFTEGQKVQGYIEKLKNKLKEL